MRWPFGPPHLTLQPSKKNKKTKKKNKNTKKNRNRNNNIQPQNKTKQTNRNKNQHQKENQKQETQKHPNLPNTNKQEEATPEKPPKMGKTSIFNTFGTMADTQKQTTITLKPQKTNPQNTFLPCSKTTHNFSYIFCFFIIQFLFLKSWALLKTL